MSQLGNRSRVGRETLVPKKEVYGRGYLKDYTELTKLGQGTFGIVFKGRDIGTGHLVAIKRILEHDIEQNFPITAFREITVLKKLQHDNIVELLKVLLDKQLIVGPQGDVIENPEALRNPGKRLKTTRSIYMVFPYMSFDLSGILQNPSVQLSESDNKSIMRQMLQGIDFIHQNGFLHRDIKAANILINYQGTLKIGDFGLARDYFGPRPTLHKPGGMNKPLTEIVMTRWYRAPEVLLGNRKYGTAIDLWAIGCVFAELYEKKPILPGKSDLDQAYDIFRLVGSPNDVTMPGYKDFIAKKKLTIKAEQPRLIERFGSKMSKDALNLLTYLLKLDPLQRLTAQAALEHPWFHSEPYPKDTIDTNFPDCHENDTVQRKGDPKQGNNNNNIPKVPSNRSVIQQQQQQRSQLQLQHQPVPPPPSNLYHQISAPPIPPPSSNMITYQDTAPLPQHALPPGSQPFHNRPRTNFIPVQQQHSSLSQQQPSSLPSIPGQPHTHQLDHDHMDYSNDHSPRMKRQRPNNNYNNRSMGGQSRPYYPNNNQYDNASYGYTSRNQRESGSSQQHNRFPNNNNNRRGGGHNNYNNRDYYNRNNYSNNNGYDKY